MPWTEEEIRKRLKATTPSATDYLGGIFKQAQDQGDAFAVEPLFPGAPPELSIPRSVTDTYRAQIKNSSDPLQTESRLKAAYLASQMYGIPVETAYDNYEAVTQELYRRSMQPKDWFDSLTTTLRASVISTRIAMNMNELWKKGPDYNYEADPLWQQVQQYKVAMPLPDEVKRSLPVEALKRVMEFVPTMVEGMDDSAMGTLAGGAAGALIGSMLIPGLGIPLLGLTAIGATMAGTAATTAAGARLGGMLAVARNSRDMERGSEYFELLNITDPTTGAKLNPKVAWTMANVYGTAAGALEAIQFDTLFKGIPGITEATKSLIIGKAKDLAKDSGQEIAENAIVKRHFLNWLGNTIGRAGPKIVDISSNTLQEVAQEAAAVFAEERAKKLTEEIDGVEITPASRQEIVKRLVDTAVGAVLGFTMMGAIPGTLRLFTSARTEVAKASVEKKTVAAPATATSLTGAQVERFDELAAQPLPAGIRFQEAEQIQGERYTLKAGDAKGTLLNAVTYDIEPGEGESPGTLTILGIHNIESPAIAKATIRQVAQQYPGWDIQWEPKTPGEQALKENIVRTNPRGVEAGLQLYRPYDEIEAGATMDKVHRIIQEQRPGWSPEDVEASTYVFQKFAQRFSMKAEDLALQSLAPHIVENYEPADPSQSFGVAYRSKFENSLRTVIGLGPNANPSTLMHEMTHSVIWFAQANRQNENVARFLTEIESAFGIKDGKWEADFQGWTEEYKYENRSYYEAVAYALEDYLAFKKAPEGKEGILAKLAQFVIDLYNGLKKARVNLSPEIESYFDKILADEDTREYSEGIPEESLSEYREENAQQAQPVAPVAGPEENAIAPAQQATAGKQNPQLSTPNDQDLEIFQGEVRDFKKTASARLARAKIMEAAGYSNEDIKADTGWSKKAAGWVLDRNAQPRELYQGAERTRRTVKELAAYAKEAGSWKDFYSRVEGQYKDLFGEDAELFKKILGATSQAASVATNVALAVKAYRQLKSGLPFTGYLPAVIKNLERIREDTGVKGQKIAEYTKANTGDEQGVAVDRHIAELLYNTQRPSAVQVRNAIDKLQKVADLLGWSPREAQAALWAYNQIRKGREPKSYDEYLEAKRDAIGSIRAGIPRGALASIQERPDSRGGAGDAGGPGGNPRGAGEGADGGTGLDRTLFQGERPIWRYKTEDVVDEKIKGAMPGRQILKTIQAAGVKADELKWTGLDDFLDTDEKKTPQEVKEYIAANKIQIKELSKYDDAVKFDSYTIPGGDNYRELLFTLPNRFGSRPDTFEEYLAAYRKRYPESVQPDEVVQNYFDMGIDIPLPNTTSAKKFKNTYKSPHWSEPNVLAHTRLDDRTVDGKKMLFIEEIQSDWHQDGRSVGYKGSLKEPSITLEKMGDGTWKVDLNGRVSSGWIGTEDEVRKEVLHGYEQNTLLSGVPPAPFSKTWHEFVFKRILRMAADGGYDAVGWTTGEQQAERYDLSKQIDSIGYAKRSDEMYRLAVWGKRGEEVYRNDSVSPSEMENVIGKEITQKIVDGVGRKEDGYTYLEDLDLKVGGEGMKGFYDKILVDFANKYGKKWGAQVQEATIDGETILSARGGRVVKEKEKLTVHSLPVTDAMLESVGLGQYLFQGDPDPKSKQYESWRENRYDAKYRFGDVIQAALKDKYGIFDNAINVPYIGPLTIHWGYTGDPANDYHDGYGLAHILIAHEDTDNVIANLENILTKGLLGPDYGRNSKPDRRWITWNGYRAIIDLKQDGERKPWLVTAFLPESEKAKGRMPLGSPTIAPSDPQAGSGPRPPEAAEEKVTKRRIIVKRHLRPNDILNQGKNVYHGSGHGFGKFSTSWIGSGEGAQAYGWGLYFTESQRVAKTQYADRLGTKGFLRTTLGDTSEEQEHVGQMAETLEEVGDLDPGTFTGKNFPKVIEAVREFNKAVRRRISELGLEVPMLSDDDTDGSQVDFYEPGEKLQKHSEMIMPAVRKAIQDTLEKYMYDAEYDPDAKTKLAYIEAMEGLIDAASGEGAIALVGGRFMYNAELTLRGDNPGDTERKAPKRWTPSPDDKEVILGTETLGSGEAILEGVSGLLKKRSIRWKNKITEIAIGWLENDKLTRFKKYTLPIISSHETDPVKIAKAEEKTTKLVKEALDNAISENKGYMAEAGFRELRNFLFGEDGNGKVRLVPAYATEKQEEFDFDAPLRNTLIRWDKPLLDDQIAAVLRFIDSEIEKLEDEDSPEMDAWQNIRQFFTFMDQGEVENSGRSLYQHMAGFFQDWAWTDRYGEIIDEGNGPRIASDILYRAGFDGIQYPVAFLVGGTGEQGMNYVMFDENAISITKRTLYQGQAPQTEGYLTEMKLAIEQGYTFEQVVEFFEAPFIDRDSWGIPDLPQDKKLLWYKEQYDALTSPEKDAPKSLESWLKGLKNENFKGLQHFLREIYEQVILAEDSGPGPWADRESVEEWMRARDQAASIRKQIAGTVSAGALALGAKGRYLNPAFLRSVYGVIAKNPEEYAGIYATLMRDDSLAATATKATKEKYADIENPEFDAVMSISQRREMAAKIRDERISRAIRSGEVNLDEETKTYIAKVEGERKAAKATIKKLESEIKEQEASLDSNTMVIAQQRVALAKTEAQINRILERMSKYLDETSAVPAGLESQRKQLEKRRESIRKKLTDARDWVELNRQYEEAQRHYQFAQEEIDRAHAGNKPVEPRLVKLRSQADAKMRELKPKLAAAEGYRNSQELQTYVAKLEERTKLQDEYKAREAEKKALRDLRAYRKKVIEQTLREPAESANVEYKKAISAIQGIIQHKYDAKTNAEEKSAVEEGDDIRLADAQNRRIQQIIEAATADPTIQRIVGQDWLAQFAGYSRREIPLSVWEEAHDKVVTLRKIGRELQIQIEAERAATAEARRVKVEEALKKNKHYQQAAGPDTTKTFLDQVKDKTFSYAYAFKNARRFLRDMDGGVDGENVEFGWHRMNRHYRQEMEKRTERQKAILDAIAASGHNPKDWYEEIITIPQAGKNDSDAILRKSDLMALALGFRDEYSRQALLYGNFFSEDEKKTYRQMAQQGDGAKEVAYEMMEAKASHKFNAIIAAIAEKLDESDLALLDDVFEKDGQATAPRLAAVVAEVENKEMARIEHYFPILRKGVTGDAVDVQIAGDILDRVSGQRRPPKNGFTKERIKIAPWNQGETNMDLLGTWLKSIELQEHYMAFAQYGRELDAVYLDRAVLEKVKGTFGAKGVEYLKDYITEIKNPTEMGNRKWHEEALQNLRGNLGAAYLGYRVSSVLKQIVTSPWPALPYAGPGLFVEAMKMMASPVKYLQETEALSTILKNRSFSIIQEAIKNADAKTKMGRFVKNAEEMGMKGLEMADRFSVAIGWRAIYNKALEEFDGDHQKAMEKADDIILKTQPASRSVDLAPAYRNKSPYFQVVLQFTQALNVVYQNIFYDIPAAIKAHHLKEAIGISVAYIISGTLLQAMTSRPPKEDEEPEEKAARYFFYGISQATDSLPLLGEEATRILKRAITGEKSARLQDSAIPGIAQFMDGLYSLSGDEIGPALEKIGRGLGMLAGAPVSGINEAARVIKGDLGALAGRKSER